MAQCSDQFLCRPAQETLLEGMAAAEDEGQVLEMLVLLFVCHRLAKCWVVHDVCWWCGRLCLHQLQLQTVLHPPEEQLPQ